MSPFIGVITGTFQKYLHLLFERNILLRFWMLHKFSIRTNQEPGQVKAEKVWDGNFETTVNG